MSRPPEYWLIGRTQALERSGLSPKDALHQAILDWDMGEQIEKQFQRERETDREATE